MVMDLRDYQKHAKRTMNFDLSADIQLANLALGIAGELGELVDLIQFPFENQAEQEESIMDEGGDVCWYIVNLCSLFSVDWTACLPECSSRKETAEFQLLAAVRFGANVADTIKKAIAQGHELDIEKVLTNIKGLIAALIELFNQYDLTLPEICEYNHFKLMKRYFNGFSTEASVNREV